MSVRNVGTDQRNKSRAEFIKKSILNNDKSNVINVLPDNFVVDSLLGTSYSMIAQKSGPTIGESLHTKKSSIYGGDKVQGRHKNRRRTSPSIRSNQKSHFLQSSGEDESYYGSIEDIELEYVNYDEDYDEEDDDDDDNEEDDDAYEAKDFHRFDFKYGQGAKNNNDEGNNIFPSRRDIILKKNNYIVVDYNPTSAQLEAISKASSSSSSSIQPSQDIHKSKNQMFTNNVRNRRSFMKKEKEGEDESRGEQEEEQEEEQMNVTSTTTTTTASLDFRNIPIMNHRELDVHSEKDKETGQMQYKSKRRRVKHGDIVKNSELNIKLRIMEQCIHPTVKEILNEKKKLSDPEVQKKIKDSQERRLQIIIDDIIGSVMNKESSVHGEEY